ncbi:MAG: PhoU domain-containing protein, partial [Acidimicrobiia bacterium]
MVFQFFKGGESTIDVVEATLVQMVLDGRDVYDTAMEALFGGGKSKETKKELQTTDRGINTAQQDVRRDLMLHASVNDTVDLPLVLAYMSTVKDVERIGDYSKNFYDLVKYGANFEDAPD